MKTITVLDTSVASDNLGDEIIMDAVYNVVSEVLPDAYCYRVPTHDWIGGISRDLLAKSELAIVGGTNILEPRMGRRGALWKVRIGDLGKMHPVMLLGVGWRGYMASPDRWTKLLLSKLMAPDMIHSVRDSFTQQKTRDLKRNIENTACMTMWSLTPKYCASLPESKSSSAVTTLTYYKADRNADREMLQSLTHNYDKVWFWPQQNQDYEYMKSLGVDNIKIIGPQLSAYDRVLENEDVDFVGTRLHGGIRAMQKGHRALIVAIDNRAQEIARDTGLPIVQRGDQATIDTWCQKSAPLMLSLPYDAIARWKSQFA